jgi:WD40 repeat protein
MVTLRGHAGAVLSATFDPSGRRLVTAGEDGSVRVWDWRAGEPAVLRTGGGPVLAVALGSAGEVNAASRDGAVRRWDRPSGRGRLALARETSAVLAAAVGREAGRAATGDFLGTVDVRDGPRTGQSAVLHEGAAYAVAISADGRRVASGGQDGVVAIWNWVVDPAARLLHGHRGAVAAVAITPDGRVVVSGGEDGTVRVWDGATGGAGAVLRAQQSPVSAVAVDADGAVVASGAEDGTVRVWAESGARGRAALTGHRGAVPAIALTPDGRLVVSGGEDGTVRVWDWRRGVQVLELDGGRGGVDSVGVTPGGRRIVSGGEDGAVRIWGCDVCGTVRKVLALSAGRVTRHLSSSEEEAFVDRRSP